MSRTPQTTETLEGRQTKGRHVKRKEKSRTPQATVTHVRMQMKETPAHEGNHMKGYKKTDTTIGERADISQERIEDPLTVIVGGKMFRVTPAMPSNSAAGRAYRAHLSSATSATQRAGHETRGFNSRIHLDHWYSTATSCSQCSQNAHDLSLSQRSPSSGIAS